jgi:hypothetical protein
MGGGVMAEHTHGDADTWAEAEAKSVIESLTADRDKVITERDAAQADALKLHHDCVLLSGQVVAFQAMLDACQAQRDAARADVVMWQEEAVRANERYERMQEARNVVIRDFAQASRDADRLEKALQRVITVHVPGFAFDHCDACEAARAAIAAHKAATE